MPDHGSVEGVDDRELLSAASALPKIPNVRVEDPDRFAQAIRALVEVRAQAGWPGETPDQEVGAFIMTPRPRQFMKRFNAIPITDPAATEDPLLGRVSLLTRDGARGHAFKMPCTPNELPDWLMDQGMGDAPLVLAYRATSIMSIRLDGANSEWCRNDAIRDHPPEVTLCELQEALGHFRLSQLLTPGFCIKGVWEPKLAAFYIPGPEPERSIQSGLTIALNSWFHGIIKAEIEDSTSVGRIDVRLLMADGNKPLAYWAIIELKVVKSFTNATNRNRATTIAPSENVEVILKGLHQAWAYQSNRKAELGLLEIFDLRQNKQDNLLNHDKISKVIASLDPRPSIKMRPLYGSADDARLAGETGV